MDPANLDEMSNQTNDMDNNDNPDDPYARDILEPVEMDMENSDEELAENEHENGDSRQHLEHDNNNPIHLPDTSDTSTRQNENGDDNSNHEQIDRHHGNKRQLDDEYGPYCDEQDSQNTFQPKESTTRRIESRIIQVVNVAPSATLEQLKTLFGYIGDILNIELYHSDIETNPETNFKVCFVEFAKPFSVSLAQHLTNTVFIDRALIILPYQQHDVIPPKEVALDEISGSKYMTTFDFGFVSHVTVGPGGIQSIATMNPRLTALGLSQYPQLPITTDPIRLEEIRRTVYIGNLDSTLQPDEVLKFFNDIGEVKYIRMAGDDTQPTRFAFVEYTNQSSVANAIQQNGFLLGSRALKINHSNNAIVKPQPKIETLDDRNHRHYSRRLRDDDGRRRSSSSRERWRANSRDRRDHRRYDRDHRDRSGSRHRRDRSRDLSNGRRDRSRDRNRYYDSHHRGADSSPLPPSSSSSRTIRRGSRSRDREVSSSSRRRSNSRDRSPISTGRRRSSRSRSRDRSSKITRTTSGNNNDIRPHDSRKRRGASRSPTGERSSSRHHHKRSRR